MSTATKTAKRGVQLTPEDAAKARAALIVALRGEVKSLEKKIEEEENALREYVAETGEKNIGPLLAYERLGVPKIEGASGKVLEAHTDTLMEQFPGYTQQKLDLTRLMAAWDTDFNLRNFFAARSLAIVRETKVYFKTA
jgi:hypothetical protein